MLDVEKDKKGGLDFFLVNRSILCSAINTDIVPGYKTDHSMITLQISVHNNPRGRGFWKLNTSFLKDEDYVNQIREIIAQTKDEYAQDDTVTPGLLWEMIKMKTREASISYGKTTKKEVLNKRKMKLKNQSKSSRNKLLTHTRMTPKNYGQN